MDAAYQTVYFDFMKLPASKDVLYDFLIRQNEALKQSIEQQRYPGNALSWTWGNIAQAAVEAYRATKEPRFVSLMLIGARIAKAKTDDKIGILDAFGQRDLVGWSLSSDGKAGREITTVSRIVSPIIEMAIFARDDKTVTPTDASDLAELAKWSVEILKPYLNKQQIKGDQRYFLNLWSGYEDAINHMAALAQASVYAYRYSGDEAFREYAVGFKAYFLAHAREIKVGGKVALSWPYQVLPSGQYDEQFWKGAVTVPALIKLNQNGIRIDADVQGELVRSFTDLVVRRFNNINAYISEREFLLTGYNSLNLGYSNGVGFTQYVMLDVWSRDVRNTVLTAIASRRDLFPRGFLMTSSDAIGYAHMIGTAGLPN